MSSGDDEPLTLAAYAANRPHTGARCGAVRKIPPDLLEIIDQAATDPLAPGSIVIRNWLADEHGIHLTQGELDYYYQRVKHGTSPPRD